MSPENSTDRLFVHCEVVEPFAENARLIGCRRSGAAALVDPGGRVQELLDVAATEALEVGAIWLTHAHLDHVTGVGDAVARLGRVPILLHRDDLPLYEAVARQGQMFGLAIDQPPPRRVGSRLPRPSASASCARRFCTCRGTVRGMSASGSRSSEPSSRATCSSPGLSGGRTCPAATTTRS